MDETGVIKANVMAQNGSKIEETSVMNKKVNRSVLSQINVQPQQSSPEVE